MPINRRAIFERDQGICGFCGQPVPWELLSIDHIQPRALGGLDDEGNLRAAHRRCNSAAGPGIHYERRRQGLPTVIERVVSLRDVDPTLWRRLRSIALLQGVTVGALLNAILRDWLAQQK